MEKTDYHKLLKFHGDHNELVSLRILNNILQVFTLGLYYPWARAKTLRYMYGETEYLDTRFVFHGTGKEIFKGFIKAVLILLALYAVLIVTGMSDNTVLVVIGFLIFVIGLTALIPLAIHGSNRYRLSRTSWRGIHFGYRGKLNELYRVYITNSLLTLLTLGLYSAWFQVELKKYIYGNIRFGNIAFQYTGKGLDLFLIRFKGILLSILTLGIYSFWFMRDLARFEMENLKILQDGKEINMRTSISPGKIFGMVFSNYFIILLTLGIGTGIAINRFMRMAFENIEFEGAINPETLLQTEEEYKDATGDDLAGMLDISLI